MTARMKGLARLVELRFRCEEITRFRDSKGLSQTLFAALVAQYEDCGNCTQTHVSKWERGPGLPDHPYMRAVVKIIRRRYEDWFEVTGAHVVAKVPKATPNPEPAPVAEPAPAPETLPPETTRDIIKHKTTKTATETSKARSLSLLEIAALPPDQRPASYRPPPAVKPRARIEVPAQVPDTPPPGMAPDSEAKSDPVIIYPRPRPTAEQLAAWDAEADRNRKG